jgi:hypothetical protein
MEIKVNGKTLDFAAALPFTLGDWRAFEKLGLMNAQGEAQIEGPEPVFKMIHHFTKKIDPNATEADVDTIAMTDLGELSTFLLKSLGAPEEPDPTSSARSTDSPAPTDGAKPRSKPSRRARRNGSTSDSGTKTERPRI